MSWSWSVLTGEIAFFCRVLGKQFIYLVANDEELRAGGRPSWLPAGTKHLVFWRVHRAGMCLADLIVVQHENQLQALETRWHRPGVVRPSAHRFPNEAEAVQRENFVLWVSRCERGKLPERFLELAQGAPDTPFVMVCPPSADTALHTRVRKAAMGIGNLRFLSFVPHAEMLELFCRARLYVNTSNSEGFPNTFVEAAMHGTPIVSLLVDPDGILALHGLGLGAEGDPMRLETFMRELLEDPARWEEASEKARTFFRRRHDIRSVSLRDREMFLSLADRAR